jgi:hypothetical protein
VILGVWLWVAVGFVGALCILQWRNRPIRAVGTTLILWIPLFWSWVLALLFLPFGSAWAIQVGTGDGGHGWRPPPWLFAVWALGAPLALAALITWASFRVNNGNAGD